MSRWAGVPRLDSGPSLTRLQRSSENQNLDSDVTAHGPAWERYSTLGHSARRFGLEIPGNVDDDDALVATEKE
jgi:hypothetical protein